MAFSIVMVLISAFLTGATAVFLKSGLKGVPPETATFIRTVVVLVIIALFMTVRGTWGGQDPGKQGDSGGGQESAGGGAEEGKKAEGSEDGQGGGLDWKKFGLIAASGLSFAAGQLCYAFALKGAGASLIEPLDKTSAMVTVIMSIIFLGEAFSWRVIAGAVLVIGGAALLSSSSGK